MQNEPSDKCILQLIIFSFGGIRPNKNGIIQAGRFSMYQENLISRRKAIGGIGATLAIMTVNGALAAPTTPEINPDQTPMLENPTTKYPRPPFKGQLQPWPGLASKMKPVPDHGEKSYKGSGRLAGRKALITGGDSGMGRAAAIAYAREGADVVISYYPTEEPAARELIELIKTEGHKAVPLPGDLREESYCKELVAKSVAGLGGLDVVISNAGRQQTRASILDITTEDFDATMKTNIYA